jgi:hypothetical protein
MVSYGLAAFFVLGFLAWPISPIRAFIAFVELEGRGDFIWAVLLWGLNLMISMGIAGGFIWGTISGYRRKMTDD